MIEPGALVGQLVDGRWLLLDHLGSGSFGDVYSAEPRHLDLATGAVKIVRPRTPAERAQILLEIQALTDLSHDGLLGYRDSGEVHDGVLAGGIYIVTELCDGALTDELGWATGSNDFGVELGAVVEQIAAALGYLHEHGFVHRDIKPSNILRAGNKWKLSDFGLVHNESEPAPAVGPQGTAPYLAPETIAAAGWGPPADIYALGVVLHEALTGEFPYAPSNGSWTAPPLSSGATIEISASVPKPWRPLVDLCVQSDPRRRPMPDQIPALIPGPESQRSFTGPASVNSRTRTVGTLRPDHKSGWRRRARWAVPALAAVALIGYAAVQLLGESIRWPTEPEIAEVLVAADPTDDAEALARALPDGFQGFVVTKATAEEYGITHLDQINDIPEFTELFDSDDDGRADIYGCPPQWWCDDVIDSTIAFSSWSNIQHLTDDYDAMFAAAMADVDAGRPMVMYIWAPSEYVGVGRLNPGENVVILSVNNVLDDSNPLGRTNSEDLSQLPGVVEIDPALCPGAVDSACQSGWNLWDASGEEDEVAASTEFAGNWQSADLQTTWTITEEAPAVYYIEERVAGACTDGPAVVVDVAATADEEVLFVDWVSTECLGGPVVPGAVFPDRTITLQPDGTAVHVRPGGASYTMSRVDGQPAAAVPELTLLVITEDTTLTGNHDGNVVISTDGVTLDCAGHRITGGGPGESAGSGIDIEARTGVTVKNCRVSGFHVGIRVARSTEVFVTNTSAIDNGSWGFVLSDGTTKSTLSGNSARDNGGHGFDIILSSENTLDSNQASGNGEQIEFSVESSSGNTLSNNTADGPGGQFHNIDSNANLFHGNTATEGGFGLNNSSDNVFTENTVSDSDGPSFHLFGPSVGNTFTGNIALNGGEGFRDNSVGGTGTAGTDNIYSGNVCAGNDLASNPAGLC